jgi:hypothetical protein
MTNKRRGKPRRFRDVIAMHAIGEGVSLCPFSDKYGNVR